MVKTFTGSEDYTTTIQRHFRTILTNKAAGRDAEEYNQLVQEVVNLKAGAFVSKQEVSQEDLRSTIENLTACVSAFHQQRHTTLLSELLSVPLWESGQELRRAVLVFVLHLAVVNSSTLQESLQLLVHNLNLPWVLALQQADDCDQEWQPSELAVAVQDDLVTYIDKILEVVPVSGSLLLPILARGLPNKVHSRSMQCTYLRGLLQIAELARAAPMRGPLIAVVVQHLVSLDVEIRWQDIAFSLDDEEEEDDDRAGGAEEQEQDIFELEGQTEEEVQLDPTRFREEGQGGECREGDVALERVTGRGGFEGAATAIAPEDEPSTSGRPQMDEAAEKLDCMMSQVFHHICNCRRMGQLAPTWHALLDSFFATVLITHKSKFTQYLLWNILYQDGEESSRLLLKRLLGALEDVRQPAIVRSAAAAYIASFLARANFLSSVVVVEYTVQLAKWCLGYCLQEENATPRPRSADELGNAAATPMGVIHQVFYAACQGLLYVLCYRLDSLMETLPNTPGKAAADSLALLNGLFRETIPALLGSRLAPMAVCLPTVVAEFTKLMARLGLLDCQGLLPTNKDAVRCQRPLEMFFPFDPYLLRRSASFLDLRRSFVRWKQGHSDAVGHENGDAKSEDDESESSEEESESDSESGSSGIGSESEEEGSVSEDEELSEAFQDLTPKDTSPVALRSAGQQIMRKRVAPAYLAASASTSGTTSPPCPMSWTPHHHVPESLTSYHRALLRPLDTAE